MNSGFLSPMVSKTLGLLRNHSGQGINDLRRVKNCHMDFFYTSDERNRTFRPTWLSRSSPTEQFGR